MEKRIMSFLRKYLVVAIALSLIILAAGFSFAEFTKSEKAKRVVAAYASTGQMFSSNVLRIGTESPYRKTLFVEKEDVEKIDAGDTTVTIDTTITICNYIQGNPRQYYGKSIDYELKGELVTLDSNGDEQSLPNTYGIKIENTLVEAYSPHSGLLTGGSPQEDNYHITIPGAVLRAPQKVFLKLTAVPHRFADIKNDICAYIEIAEKPEAVKAGWSIECTDPDIETHFSEYYGYNWRLSGIGQGTVTLSWNNNNQIKVYLSEACLQSLNNLYPGKIDDSDIETGTLVITVDSDVTTSYDLQFYPKTGNDAPTGFSDIKVTCNYSASNS